MIPEQEFRDYIRAQGWFEPNELIGDGQFHAFDVHKKGDKAARYKIFPNGTILLWNWKSGEQQVFSDKSRAQVSEAERRENEAKYREQKRRQQEETEQGYVTAAEAVGAIWKAAQPAPEDHWYLVKKGIKPHTARLNQAGELIYPIYYKKELVNIQRVLPEGKKFHWKARKKACYGAFSGETDIVFIAEGFATAASITEATGKMCIAALDAGNLIHVGIDLRNKLDPQTRIIIAADNDQWRFKQGSEQPERPPGDDPRWKEWRSQGLLENIGIAAANNLAEKIRAQVVIPPIPEDDAAKRTDWNDWGADGILLNLPTQVPASENRESGGFINLIVNEKGKPKAIIENLNRLCQNQGITIRYNVIKKYDEILIPAKSYSMDNKLNASYADIVSLCKNHDIATDHIKNYITNLSDRNLYNPVTTWILSREWDGVSRLQEFYDTVQAHDTSLKEIILKRWMISAIAAAFNPNGVSAHGVLIFRGEQNVGKTSWFKKLAPKDLDVLQDGCILKLDDKDSIFHSLSHWIVELGELEATFKKSDIAQLKAFLTKDKDIIRRPFAPLESFYARRTVFFASVNEKEFLFDPTGNRRFWSIETTGINYMHELDMQQVWAEFYQLYLDGDRWILLPDEMILLMNNNKEFLGTDTVEDLIFTKLDWDNFNPPEGEWHTATEIAKMLGVATTITNREATRVARAVKQRNGNIHKRSGKEGRLLLIPHRKPNFHEIPIRYYEEEIDFR